MYTLEGSIANSPNYFYYIPCYNADAQSWIQLNQFKNKHSLTLS